jgi:hypothetical protein
MVQSADDIVALLAPLRSPEPPSGPYEQVPAASYLSMSHDGLRQVHARQTAERPDAAVSHELAGSHLHLWARQGPDRAPWVALVTSVSRPGRIALNAGYRVIVGDPDEAAALAADPARALATLVTRHGVTYYSGTRRVYLLPEHIIDISRPLDRLGPAEFQKAVALEEPPEGASVAVNVALSNTSDGSTRLSWFFVLNLTAYSEEVAALRR